MKLITGVAAPEFPFNVDAVLDHILYHRKSWQPPNDALRAQGFVKCQAGSYRNTYVREANDFVVKVVREVYSVDFCNLETEHVFKLGRDLQQRFIPTWQPSRSVLIQAFAPPRHIAFHRDAEEIRAVAKEAGVWGDVHPDNIGYIGDQWYFIDWFSPEQRGPAY